MRRKLCLFSGACLAAAAVWATVKENSWRPAWTAIEPLCAATDWDQEGALNAYFGYESEGETKYDACGCDPLAWGQVVVYHALNHGFPAAGWEPTPVTATVNFLGVDISRTTMSGPYDWEAIRDKVWEKDGEGKTLSCPVGRLMWDLGIIGNAKYAYDTLATCWSYDSTSDATIYTYFNYAGKGYRYTAPVVNEVQQPYWREMLRTLLRTSLQAGAPVVTSIQLSGGGHMVVTDGYGVDANGKEWFHIDYAWQSVKGYWWDLDEFIANVNAVYTFVSPTDLGGVIAGRVTTPTGAPIAGATLVVSNGRDARVVTTDAAGLYTFAGFEAISDAGVTSEDLARRYYTVTALAEGCEVATQCVALTAYVDDDRQSVKQGEAEKALGKDAFYTFPLMIGSALADFTLTPRLFFAPGASGSGRSWADPAALSAAALADRAGYACYLAAGTYTLSSTLVLPAGTSLSGGYDPETGLADPFATPTELVFNASSVKDRYVALAEGAQLCGVTLSGSADVGSALYAESGLAAKPSVTAVTFGATMKADYYAQQVALTCCRFDAADRTVQLEGCDRLHCSFFAYACEDKDGQDLGGNRFLGSTDVWRPTGELICPEAGTAGHTCPELGLDGRPLNQTQGALAPAGGYTLSLQ